MTAPAGAGVPGPAGDWHAEYAERVLRRQLDELLRGVLPAHHVEVAVAAMLSDASPLVTPAAHSAAVRRETDWQHHWLTKFQAAEIEAGKLRRALDVTALERVRTALALVADLRPSKTAAHDATCHTRHAACLAERVREALSEERV